MLEGMQHSPQNFTSNLFLVHPVLEKIFIVDSYQKEKYKGDKEEKYQGEKEQWITSLRSRDTK